MANRSTPIKIFVIALETSGDLLASYLINKLSSQPIPLYFEGVTGSYMKKENVTSFASIDDFSTMGISGLIKKIPAYARLRKRIINHLLTSQFDVVITVDSSTFNLPLAKKLRKKGFQGRLIHYVCPTIWAYRKKRKELLVKNYDLLLHLFAFEDRLFDDTPLPSFRIGHPLLSVQPIEKSNPTHITLFPGSRLSIIQRMLPLQYKAALHYNLPIAISLANPNHLPYLKKIAPTATFFLEEEKVFYLQKTHFAIATSGTVNLELALYEIPTVVVYELSSFDAFFAKHLFKLNLPYYSMPNLLLNESLFPELYGTNLQIKELIDKISYLKLHPPLFCSSRLKATLAPTIDDKELQKMIVHTNYTPKQSRTVDLNFSK